MKRKSLCKHITTRGTEVHTKRNEARHVQLVCVKYVKPLGGAVPPISRYMVLYLTVVRWGCIMLYDIAIYGSSNPMVVSDKHP